MGDWVLVMRGDEIWWFVFYCERTLFLISYFTFLSCE
jgi:hypothetical protein